MPCENNSRRATKNCIPSKVDSVCQCLSWLNVSRASQYSCDSELIMLLQLTTAWSPSLYQHVTRPQTVVAAHRTAHLDHRALTVIQATNLTGQFNLIAVRERADGRCKLAPDLPRANKLRLKLARNCNYSRRNKMIRQQNLIRRAMSILQLRNNPNCNFCSLVYLLHCIISK